MGWLHYLLEPEEAIGRLWHRLVAPPPSWPDHPDAAVELDSVQTRLGVWFRGLGGDPGLGIEAAAAEDSAHRRRLRHRLGGGGIERITLARCDATGLRLPRQIALFADPALNRDLYLWLAAFFAALPPAPPAPEDPLQADLLHLRLADLATRRALQRWPGLRPKYRALAAALCAAWPARGLGGLEAEIDQAARALLGGADSPLAHSVRRAPQSLHTRRASADYRPLLPVPIWGVRINAWGTAPARDGEAGGGALDARDGVIRRARRQRFEQAERTDPLILNRFEKMLAIVQMLNINRMVDDDEPETAKKALDDMDRLQTSSSARKPAARLKLDLDFPPGLVEDDVILSSATQSEWDFRRGAYRRRHVRCLELPPPAAATAAEPPPDLARRIRRVRRQFEALRPGRQWVRGELEGEELDLEAVIRAACDHQAAGAASDHQAAGAASDRVFAALRPQTRDLAVSLLLDASLSTDAWVDGQRVLSVAKQALEVLAHGIDACGDACAIWAFSSRRRDHVLMQALKRFSDPFGPAVTGHIRGLVPGYYTRLGAAIRHVAADLAQQPQRRRLILLLTDGKPNDVDYYEGRYGIEDTRMAVIEARRRGLAVFAITIDREAQAYVPHIFGKGGFAMVGHLARLTAALPRIYRQVAT